MLNERKARCTRQLGREVHSLSWRKCRLESTRKRQTKRDSCLSFRTQCVGFEKKGFGISFADFFFVHADRQKPLNSTKPKALKNFVREGYVTWTFSLNQRGISSVFFVAEVWASSQNFSSTECNTFFLETFDTLSLSSTITHEYEWPISNDGESFVRASPLQNGMWIFRKLPTTHDNRIWTILLLLDETMQTIFCR